MKPRILLTSCAALITCGVHAQIVPTPGTTKSGYRGSLEDAADLSKTATAFADDVILGGALAPTHTVPNVNNGTYGNASSWIGGSYVGLSWGNDGQTISSIAFGRSNTGDYGDRNFGNYILQYTTADLSSLVIPTTGNTAGIVGGAAEGFGWVTIAGFNYQTPDGGFATPTANSYRNRFDLPFAISGVTGLRLIAPGGAAIDQFEVYTSRGAGGPLSSQLTIAPSAGYTIGWDGNDGVHFDPAALAPVPKNLATNATPITSSDLGIELNLPFHRAVNVNDGFYGNDHSWISASADTTSPFAGVTFNGGARHVGSVAWGRDNGNNVADCCGGVLADRSLGLYTLQSLDPDDNTTWVTLGTFNYTGTDDGTVGGGFTSWLRHEYSLATAGGALRSAGIRLIVPPGGFGSNAIDELEVYGTTMTWTNAAATGKWNLNADANFGGAADGKFLTEDKVHFGEAGAGTVTIEGNLTPGDVTVDAAANYTFTGPGSIGGTAALTKRNSGNLTLTGAHTYSGTTTVAGGTLTLDFANVSAPAANIINQLANDSALVIGDATLVLAGRANTTNSQQFNGTTFTRGASSIQLNADAVANPLALNLGALTREIGSTVNFTLPAGTASASNGVATSSGDAESILTLDGVAFATVGGNDWAAQAAGLSHVVGLSTIAGGYTPSTATSLTGNADVASGVDTVLAGGSITLSTRFNQNEGRTITIDPGQKLVTGGILVTSNVATAGSAINGGALAGVPDRELVVIQNSSQPFTIGSTIEDNLSRTGLTKAGSGNLVLTAQNTFTGDIFVSGGTLTAAGNASLSASSLGANVPGRSLTIARGATLVSIGTDAVDFQSTTVNPIAFHLNGTWNNNPDNLPDTGFQRVDQITLDGATINDGGAHPGGYGGILLAGNVHVTGNTPSVYHRIAAGFGLGLGTTTFDVEDVTGSAAADFTVDGPIRNTAVSVGSLQKRGAGTMVLGRLNFYTGATIVTGGTLSLQGDASLPLYNVWVGNGARLAAEIPTGTNRHDLIGNVNLAGGTLSGNNNFTDTNAGQFYLNDAGQRIIVHGDVTSTIATDLHMAGTHIFDVDNGAAAVDLLVTGRLSHHHTVAWGGVRKTGTGTMHLAGSMDGTNAVGVNGIYGLGGFELAGGTLLFSGSLGYSAFSPANKAGYFLADFSGPATLKWDVGNTFDPSVNGNLRIRDGVVATFDTNGNTVTIANPIIAGAGLTGGLTKTGNGTLILSAFNSYQGATSVNQGTLSLRGTSSNPLYSVTVANGATLSADVAAGNNRHDLVGNLVLNGGTLAGNANISDSNTGQFLLSTPGAQVIVFGDTQSHIAADTHLSGTHTFVVTDGAAAVDLLVTGRLSHFHTVAWGGAVKTGPGTMHLASSMNGTNAAGANGIYGLGGFELAGGTLIFSGSLGYSAFNPASKAGYFLADFSAATTLRWDAGNTNDPSVNGNLRIRDGVTATLDTNGNDVTLSAPIVFGPSSSGSLTKIGDGTLTLSADDSHSGTTSVLDGTLELDASQTFGALVIGDGASAVLDGNAAPAPAFSLGEISSGSSLPAVPEPGVAMLLLGGMLSLISARRRA